MRMDSPLATMDRLLVDALYVFHPDTLLAFLQLHQHAVINKLNGFWR